MSESLREHRTRETDLVPELFEASVVPRTIVQLSERAADAFVAQAVIER